VGVPIFAPSPMAMPPPVIASRPAAGRLNRKERIAGAWLEVEQVFGGGKYTKWLRDGRLTDDEALEFEKLASDTDKKQVRAVMLQNRSFREAVDSLTGLNPQNSIQDLHTKRFRAAAATSARSANFCMSWRSARKAGPSCSSGSKAGRQIEVLLALLTHIQAPIGSKFLRCSMLVRQ
jgi:hypothetical protein